MELINKLKRIISQKNWYEISTKNYNSAGLLLEKLLGLENNDLPISDYNEYEIKTKFEDSMYDTTLFHAAPDSYLYEIKRIYEKYGYSSPSNNSKVFLSAFYCNKITTLGSNTCAKLYIDYINEKIVLKFYNFETNEIDEKASWNFNLLKERINLKIKKLVVVWVKRKFNNNKLYCQFYKFAIYEFKGFEQFLKCLEYGKISIKFCINIYKSGTKLGQIHDHGTSFDINVDNIWYAFKKIC